MNVRQIDISPNNISNDKNSIKEARKDSEQFANVLRETEIRTEIALKCSKLPDPNVLVDPRAIARMAKDKNFYDKVMSKIDSFTGNQNISLNYPSITYSLVVDADGEWVETMVNEELKKQCEESSKKDKETSPLNSLFAQYEQNSSLRLGAKSFNSYDSMFDSGFFGDNAVRIVDNRPDKYCSLCGSEIESDGSCPLCIVPTFISGNTKAQNHAIENQYLKNQAISQENSAPAKVGGKTAVSSKSSKK